jgi:WhiB family redox-sensing transcriptional regulator
MKSTEWMELAACRGVEPELFFTEKKPGVPCSRTARAKEICSTCPVQAQCLDFATATSWVQHGVWAGLEGYEIRKLSILRAGGTLRTRSKRGVLDTAP